MLAILDRRLARALFCLALPAMAERQPAAAPEYPELFAVVRKISVDPAIRTSVEKALKSKELIESQLVGALLANPEVARNLVELSATDLKTKAAKTLAGLRLPDPTKPVRLVPPQGDGYSNLRLYVTHARIKNGRKIPADDVRKAWVDFFESAKKQIDLNVYEFDLPEAADVLIRKAKDGVSVRVGIDAKVIEDEPEVKVIYERLKKGGIDVIPVVSSGLNHQKMSAIDWDSPRDARVLVASANLTQTCSGPEGDLKDVPSSQRPPNSVPNANHLITLNSWVLAQLIHHELSKVLEWKMPLKPGSFPESGTYQVTGEGINGKTAPIDVEPSLEIGFSPGGALRDVNQNLLARAVARSDAPIYITQFTFASSALEKAILERAIKAKRQGKELKLLAVGDPSSATATWSSFLSMSGMIRDDQLFKEDPTSPWPKALGEDDLADLRKRILVGPAVYGNSFFKWQGQSLPVSARIHHKVLSASPFAVLGTSFNFSANAETNQEQVLVFRDRELAEEARSIVEALAADSEKSVWQATQDSNKKKE